eukprot:SAG31_NODE_3366_length_4358_cov_2.048133_1_plen_130_part_00
MSDLSAASGQQRHNTESRPPSTPGDASPADVEHPQAIVRGQMSQSSKLPTTFATPEKQHKISRIQAWVESVSHVHEQGYESPESSAVTTVSDASSVQVKQLQQRVRDLEQAVRALSSPIALEVTSTIFE